MLRKGWNRIAYLFFPPLCTLCKQLLLDSEKHICLSCLCNLPYADSHRQAGNLAAGLFAGKVAIQSSFSFLFYSKGNEAQRLTYAFKYYGNKHLAYQLGRQAALFLQTREPYASLDYLIPVPLHRTKERRRGYNQSEWIGRGVASVLAIPVHTKALVRHIPTETQTNKSPEERWANVRHAFSLEQTDDLAGRDILLVDDIVTSGATLRACAETLLAIPGIRIHTLTLAIRFDTF
jgi:ComF family protein